jgi:hydrogenase maturation protein HypF
MTNSRSSIGSGALLLALHAAMWLEQLARSAPATARYPFPFADGELDFRPLLMGLAHDRYLGRDPSKCARKFQRGIAQGLFDAVTVLCQSCKTETVVLSGGVFQNELLLEDLKSMFDATPFQIWTNHVVPANDGGISLGQAALASFGRFDSVASESSRDRDAL